MSLLLNLTMNVTSGAGTATLSSNIIPCPYCSVSRWVSRQEQAQLPFHLISSHVLIVQSHDECHFRSRHSYPFTWYHPMSLLFILTMSFTSGAGTATLSPDIIPCPYCSFSRWVSLQEQAQLPFHLISSHVLIVHSHDEFHFRSRRSYPFTWYHPMSLLLNLTMSVTSGADTVTLSPDIIPCPYCSFSRWVSLQEQTQLPFHLISSHVLIVHSHDEFHFRSRHSYPFTWYHPMSLLFILTMSFTSRAGTATLSPDIIPCHCCSISRWVSLQE